MGDHEKDPRPENVNDEQSVEVEELDDKSLEEVAGGVADAELASGDTNGFMCNC